MVNKVLKMSQKYDLEVLILSFMLVYCLGFVPIYRNIITSVLIVAIGMLILGSSLLSLKTEYKKTAYATLFIILSYFLYSLFHFTTIDVIKDLVRMLFLMTGVFLWLRQKHSNVKRDLVTRGVLIGGVFLSLSLYFFIWKFGIFLIFSGKETMLMGVSSHLLGALFYEPLISFSAIFFTLSGLQGLKSGKASSLYLLIGVILFVPWVLVFLRFYTAYYIGITLLFIIKFWPKKNVLLLLLSLIIAVAIWCYISPEAVIEIIQKFLNKITKLGATQKTIELKAVISASDSWVNIIFGNGLGQKYFNPIYKGERMYTHSLLSYIYLKFGLLGLVPVAYIVFSICKKAIFSILFSKNSKKFIITASWALVMFNSFYFQTTYSFFSYFLIMYFISDECKGNEVSLS